MLLFDWQGLSRRYKEVFVRHARPSSEKVVPEGNRNLKAVMAPNRDRLRHPQVHGTAVWRRVPVKPLCAVVIFELVR